MKLDSLEKLYAHQLKDLWSAENQIAKKLGGYASKIHNDELRQALEEHLKETQGQIGRLESIFEKLEYGPHGHHCDGMDGLLTEAGEIWNTEGEPQVLDAAAIAALQRVEHYEMAAYGSARAFAQKLGFQDQAELLTQSLEEEGLADRKLTELAERSLNFEAMVAS